MQTPTLHAIDAAQRLYRELHRAPTQKELRARGVSTRFRTSDILRAAGVPVRPQGGRQERLNDVPVPVLVAEREAYAKTVQALRGYKYQRPTDDLPLTSWMP